VRIVVAGDGTAVDQYIEVLPKGMPIVVSDVDGTLTERAAEDIQLVCDEESDPAALVKELLGGSAQPHVHEGAPEVYSKLASLGYRPLYLTARPEWLEPHTHAFLRESARGDGRGDLPEGIVHTTLTELGALPNAAKIFKQDELTRLRDKGFKIVLGFGDQQSDVQAYSANQVQAAFFYEKRDTTLRSCSDIKTLALFPSGGIKQGSWRIEAYGDLLPSVEKLQPICAR
jgi:phosphatidate phosphatase PAH1